MIALAAHQVESFGEGIEGCAHVARDGDGMFSCAGFVGAYFGEGREEGGEVGAAAVG